MTDTYPLLVRWANTSRAHGMPTPEQCEADGYTAVGPLDPRYPLSILYEKTLRDDN